MRGKRICIIAFKSVRTTIHVLRQIDYLAPRYNVTVIGHGSPDPEWPPVTWSGVPKQNRVSQVSKLFWFVLGRILPIAYKAWFWSVARHKLAYESALASGADAIHANDWEALPIAVEVARRTGGRVIFHTHEYHEESGGNKILWRLLVGPAVRHFIRKYVADPDVRIDAFITVCEPIARRYQQELGLQPIVVFNAPRPVDVPPRAEGSDAESIRLIHHGYAKRGRGLHTLIEALALTDRRFTLDFMLMEDDPGYVAELKRLADRLAPGKVGFRDPVRPTEIVGTVAQYDLGFCVIAPSCYNNLMMLPNKLFEYIQAGLAVCVGPSPAMADLVRQHAVGVVAPSFTPGDIAATLNGLTDPQVRRMQRAARRAAGVLNADVEMDKIVTLYHRLLDGEGEPVARAFEVTAHSGPSRERKLLPMSLDRDSVPEPVTGRPTGCPRRACMVVQNQYPADPRVRREAEALLSAGWLLDIVCLRGPGERRNEKGEHGDIYRLSGKRRWGSSLAVYLFDYVAFFILAAARVSWLSLRHHFDFVQVHNVPDFLVFTTVLPRLLGARLVLDIHDPLPDLYLSKFGGNHGHPTVTLMRWIEATSTAFVDLVLTPGEPSRRRLVGRRVPPEKVANVLNSADPRLFPPMIQTGTQRRKENSFSLVYHGGLFERYGLDIAIKAVNQLRNEIPGLRLRIAGFGETVDDLKQLIAQLDLADRVSFAGWVAPAKIAEFIGAADLGVVPYRQDTFTDLIYPTKVFECIAVGVPVIMSGLAGIVELFPDIPDLFFRPDDVDDLARHILRLYQEPTRLQRLNAAIQLAYVPYNWEGQRREYLSLVERLVNGRGGLVVAAPASRQT